MDYKRWNQGWEMGLVRWTCSFCPHFSAGRPKGLCYHPLMCLTCPAFFADFCGRVHLLKFLRFQAYKVQYPQSFFVPPSLFCKEGVSLTLHPQLYSSSSIPFFTVFCGADLNRADMPICHPQVESTTTSFYDIDCQRRKIIV